MLGVYNMAALVGDRVLYSTCFMLGVYNTAALVGDRVLYSTCFVLGVYNTAALVGDKGVVFHLLHVGCVQYSSTGGR